MKKDQMNEAEFEAATSRIHQAQESFSHVDFGKEANHAVNEHFEEVDADALFVDLKDLVLRRCVGRWSTMFQNGRQKQLHIDQCDRCTNMLRRVAKLANS